MNLKLSVHWFSLDKVPACLLLGVPCASPLTSDLRGFIYITLLCTLPRPNELWGRHPRFEFQLQASMRAKKDTQEIKAHRLSAHFCLEYKP